MWIQSISACSSAAPEPRAPLKRSVSSLVPVTSCAPFGVAARTSFAVTTRDSPFTSGHVPAGLPFRYTVIDRALPPRARASMTGGSAAGSVATASTAASTAVKVRVNVRAPTRAHVAPSRSMASTCPRSARMSIMARDEGSPRSRSTPR